MWMLRIIKAGDSALDGFLRRAGIRLEKVIDQVAPIIHQVRKKGDRALVEFTRNYDGVEIGVGDLQVKEAEIEEAYQLVEPEFLAALKQIMINIKEFHLKQLPKSWWDLDEEGNVLGQLYRPLKRVGLYIPGGRAAYPSSVLMTAVPGMVAGVEELVMVSPPDREGRLNPYTLVAASEAGVQSIFKVGGAQAIAALAYGTESIRPVDKIVGPGNIYVTAAKKLVYGQVDIDMLAGPSEILIVADSSADPVFLAADLLAQAEHDPLAAAVLVTPDQTLAKRVISEIEKQLKLLPRREIAQQALAQAGGVILTRDLEEAMEVANDFAPEHLELCLAEPFLWLGKVKNAGAIFLGHHSPEALGDYYAGPNHVLPTGGTARYFSPLNVEMYLKKSSLISYTPKGLARAAQAVVKIAAVEGLEGHANSIRVRLESQGTGVEDNGQNRQD
jgi:histidinol dehydrogenase